MRQMRRAALAGALALGTSVLACGPALAGERLEGEGYAITLPDGFREALSMSGSGSLKIRSRLGALPIDGVPETTVYVSGDMANPRGSVFIARVNLKSGHTVKDLDGLGLQQLESMRDRLPEGFDVKARKVGSHDAIEMTMEMEAFEQVHQVRIVSIAGGSFVMVVMLETSRGAYPDSSLLWESMLGSLELREGPSKVLLYGGIALGVFVLLVVLRRVAAGTSRSRAFVEVSDWRRPSTLVPAGGAPATHAAPTPPARLRALPPVPAGLQSSRVDRPRPVRPFESGRPAEPAPAQRPGLRATLPPSGNWRDRAK